MRGSALGGFSGTYGIQCATSGGDVYDGLRHVGTIAPGKRKPWRAISADGRSLGEHQFERDAMAALQERLDSADPLKRDPNDPDERLPGLDPMLPPIPPEE